MTLASEYLLQRTWRDWERIYALLPDLAGKLVLDLGCGVGSVASDLAARGATVLGIDSDEELIAVARSREIRNVSFRHGDIREPLEVIAKGIWCSFAAAYLSDLEAVLAQWAGSLTPGGFLVLVEIDDMFAHEPMPDDVKDLLGGFVDDALKAGRYDFCSGRRLRGALERTGFVVEQELRLDDRELAFNGPAPAEILTAWDRRFDRMQSLRAFAGERFERVRGEFLRCLSSEGHRTDAVVFACVARR